MKHATNKKSPNVKVGQLYRMPSGSIAKVVHLRGENEVGLQYENKRYKGRAEQVAMSTVNVKNICTYLGEVNEETES